MSLFSTAEEKLPLDSVYPEGAVLVYQRSSYRNMETVAVQLCLCIASRSIIRERIPSCVVTADCSEMQYSILTVKGKCN